LVANPLALDDFQMRHRLARQRRAFASGPIFDRWLRNLVGRDYTNLYNQFISLGPLARNGMGAHGVKYDVADVYDEIINSERQPVIEWGGRKYPSLKRAEEAADMILTFAPETNGELAYRAYQFIEKKVGLPLADLAEASR